MFKIIDIQNYYPELIYDIDLQQDIVILTQDDYKYFKKNQFGKIDLLTNKRIDLSICNIINEFGIYYFNPKMKLLLPYFVDLKFENNNFVNYFKLNYLHEFKKFHLYSNFNFELYMDLNYISKKKNSSVLDYGSVLLSMNFIPYYNVNYEDINDIRDVYLIRNSELLNQIEDILKEEGE